MKDVFLTRDLRGPFSDCTFMWRLRPRYKDGVFIDDGCSGLNVSSLISKDSVPPGHMLRLTVAETIDCRPPKPIEWTTKGPIQIAELGSAAAIVRKAFNAAMFAAHAYLSPDVIESVFRDTESEARDWCEAELRKAAGR